MYVFCLELSLLMAGIGDAQLGQTLNWQNDQNDPKHFYDTSKYMFPINMLHNPFDLSTGLLYALAEFLLGLQEPFQFLLNDSTVSQQAKPMLVSATKLKLVSRSLILMSMRNPMFTLMSLDFRGNGNTQNSERA